MGSRQNKRTHLSYLRYALAFALCLFLSPGRSVAQEEGKQAVASGGPNTEAGAYVIENYAPYVLGDNRIRVKKISYNRSLSLSSDGDILEFIIDLRNATTEPIDLYCFFIAFYETDLVNRKYYKWIHNMNWRKRDFATEDRVIINVSSSPKEISPAIVWNQKDPDSAYYTKLIERQRKLISTVEPLPRSYYPPIWKYLEYTRYNPKKGMRFTIPGHLSPTPEKSFEASPMAKKKGGYRYYLQHSIRRTIIRSFFLNIQTTQKPFYNRVAIVLYDAEQIKEKAGKSPNELYPVFKRIYSITSTRPL